MKTTWIVAAREIAARRTVLYAGLMAALLALASPLLPGAARANATDVRAIVVLLLGTSVAAGSALLVGASLFGPDLAEKRLAWYYSRPIPASALWWGKVCGGLFVVLVASAIAWSPALLSRSTIFSPTATGWTVVPYEALTVAAFAAGFLYGLLLLANAASIAFRSRSPWLLLDGAGLAVTGTGFWAATTILLRAAGGNFLPEPILFVVIAAVAIIALQSAGWRQVAVGRTDPKAAHAAMSKTLWAILVPAALAAAGYAKWAASYSPSDLRHPDVSVGPTGKWVLLTGQVARRVPSFYASALVDSETGAFVRLSWRSARTLTISRDGRRVAWAERDAVSLTEPAIVMFADAATPGVVPTASRVVIGRPGNLERLTLSPDGSRIAVLTGENLAVHDLETGAIVASTRIPAMSAYGQNLFFETPTSIVVYPPFVSGGWQEVEIARFDLVTRKLEKTGTVDCGEARSSFLRIAPAGDRMLHTSGFVGTWLLDAATGRRIASLAPPDEFGNVRSQLLSDGRVAVGSLKGGDLTLHLFSRDGVQVSSIPLGPARSFRLGGEAAPGKLVVNLSSRPAQENGSRFGRIAVVDLARGTVTEVGDDLSIAVLTYPLWIPSDLPWHTPGSLGARLFRTRDDRFLLIDPVTLRLAPFSLGGR